jgi:hypothetical protein
VRFRVTRSSRAVSFLISFPFAMGGADREVYCLMLQCPNGLCLVDIC